MTTRVHRSLAITVILCALGVVAPSSPATAATAILTVGAGSDCDYSDIQVAIDVMASYHSSADTKIIRIARDQFYNNVSLTVINDSITLEGGYDTCDSPSPGQFGATLRGNGARSVLKIYSTDGGPHKVRVRKVGVFLGSAVEGAGIEIAGNVEVVLDSVSVAENVAQVNGGGLKIVGGSLVMENVTFLRNEANANGGAIFCLEGSILGLGGNSFHDNDAAGLGGAIYLERCDMTLEGSHLFTSNSAASGGAIAADVTDIELTSSHRGRVEIRGNTTIGAGDHLGGGILLRSGNLVGIDVRLESNEVNSPDGCGGGIATETGHVTLMPSGRLSCDGGSCSTLVGNQARRGTAGCITDGGGSIDVVNSRIEGNGSLGSENTFRVESGSFNSVGNVLVSNTGATLIEVMGSSQATVAFSTVSNNRSLDRVIRVLADGGGASAKLYSSIVWEGSGIPIFETDASATIDSECLLVSETSSLPSLGNVILFDPNFVDPNAGDYHLQSDSVAIDFCDAESYPSPAFDIDNGYRGVDDPGTANGFPGAVFDAGADEFGSSDQLFADGFESGTADGWSFSTF